MDVVGFLSRGCAIGDLLPREPKRLVILFSANAKGVGIPERLVFGAPDDRGGGRGLKNWGAEMVGECVAGIAIPVISTGRDPNQITSAVRLVVGVTMFSIASSGV